MCRSTDRARPSECRAAISPHLVEAVEGIRRWDEWLTLRHGQMIAVSMNGSPRTIRSKPSGVRSSDRYSPWAIELGHAPSDRRRLLETVTGEAVGVDEVGHFVVGADDHVVVDGVVGVVPGPLRRDLDSFERRDAVDERRPDLLLEDVVIHPKVVEVRPPGRRRAWRQSCTRRPRNARALRWGRS